MTSALQKIIALPAVSAFHVIYTSGAGMAYRAIVNGEQIEAKRPSGQTVDGWLERVLARFVKLSTTRVDITVKDISRKEKHDDKSNRKPEGAEGSEGRDETNPEAVPPPRPH